MAAFVPLGTAGSKIATAGFKIFELEHSFKDLKLLKDFLVQFLKDNFSGFSVLFPSYKGCSWAS